MILAILRSSHLVKLALVGLVIGAGFLGYARTGAPVARDSLHSIEATVTAVARVTRSSHRSGLRSSHYALTLRPGPDGAAGIDFTLPTTEAAESQIRGAIGQRARVDYAAEDDVYGLSVAGNPVLTYEEAVRTRRLGFRQYEVDGIAILVGSLVVLLVSGGLAWRRLRRHASARGHGQPPANLLNEH